MSVRYISVRDDRFSARTKSADAGAAPAAEPNSPRNHRRPLNGLEIYEDTYATISVTGPTGKPRRLKHTGGLDIDDVYTSSLIVQSISESREEKQQMIPTFGDDYAYYFGQRPRMITVNAVLPHAENFQWNQEFWTNYDKILRGTKLVDTDSRVYLYIDRQVFEGYLLNADTTRSADSQHVLQLRFTMHVTASVYTDELRNSPVKTLFDNSAFDAADGRDARLDLGLEMSALPTSLIALKAGQKSAERADLASRTSALKSHYAFALNTASEFSYEGDGTAYLFNRPHDYVTPIIGGQPGAGKLKEAIKRSAPATQQQLLTTEIVLQDNLIFSRTPLSIAPTRTRVRRTQTTEVEFLDDTGSGIVDKMLRVVGSPLAQNLLVGAAAAAALVGIASAAYDEYGDDISRVAGEGDFWSKLSRVSSYLWDTASSAVVNTFTSLGEELESEFSAAGYSFIGQNPPSASRDLEVADEVAALPAASSVTESSGAARIAQSTNSTDLILGAQPPATAETGDLTL